MADVVWIDGELVPTAEATVSVLDHGLTAGDGVFETIKVYDDVPVAARRHLARLRSSAAVMALAVPWSDAELRGAVVAVATQVSRLQARVRITVTGGVGPPGLMRGGPPTVIITAGHLAAAEPSVAVCTVPWPRNERSPLAGVKTTSYAESVHALAYAHAQSADNREAIFANTAGRLCEGTTSNVFVATGGQLFTPPLGAGCLAGVTRALVMEVVAVVEEDLPLAVLETADEIFLTSTTRDVQPVHQVDDRRLVIPGPLTAAAQQAYRELLARDLDP